MKQLRIRMKRLLQNGSIINTEERERIEFLLKTKKFNPYCLRHSAITSDSDYLPEYALKKKVRWSMNSKQGTRNIKEANLVEKYLDINQDNEKEKSES